MQPNFPRQILLCSKAHISGKTISREKKPKKGLSNPSWRLWIEGGTALIPAFAIGRTQEILMLLDAHGIRAYVDGMGRDVYKILQKIS